MKNDTPVTERGMAIVGRRVSFAEAEEIDNGYWMNASVEERFQTLIDLNSMVFGQKMEGVDLNFIGYNELLILKQLAGRPQDLEYIYKLKQRNKI